MPWDIIILHLCTTNDYHMMYSSWHINCDRHNFWHFELFLPLYPHNNLKNQNFEKMKDMPADIIILHLCHTNDNHMVYGTQQTNFFCYFVLAFALIPPWQLQKSKFWKNEKNPGDIIILLNCTVNYNHMMYSSWDMKHNRQDIFVILGHLLPFYPTNNP